MTRYQAGKGITILGSTGTIGVNTLDVIGHHADRYTVIALTANRNVERMFTQCLEFEPRYAVMCDEASAGELRHRLEAVNSKTAVLADPEGLEFVASLDDTDYVMAGIVGAAGLLPTLAAARAGKRVLLANKESLVMSGQLFMQTIKDSGARLLPIDSEHNAVFQCMPATSEDSNGVERIMLTASGGPFREMTAEAMEKVTPAQACAHPNWVMGRKISVDSATMMNKGLEIIEAYWLFNTPSERIDVLVHPQSVIHSMVSYTDGSVLAQLGNPDMRTPIAYALAWPERIASGVPTLDLLDVGRLDFETPDEHRFPCLRLARLALEAGGTSTTVLNAANEVAVQSFLDEEIGFTTISHVIEETLSRINSHEPDSIEIILEADAQARVIAREIVSNSLLN